MIKRNTFLLLVACITSLTSCEAIGNIFKAGVWVGALIVVIIIAVLLFIFRKRG